MQDYFTYQLVPFIIENMQDEMESGFAKLRSDKNRVLLLGIGCQISRFRGWCKASKWSSFLIPHPIYNVLFILVLIRHVV